MLLNQIGGFICESKPFPRFFGNIFGQHDLLLISISINYNFYLCFQILRIGFYEIVKLNMPQYAVVDEVISAYI